MAKLTKTETSASDQPKVMAIKLARDNIMLFSKPVKKSRGKQPSWNEILFKRDDPEKVSGQQVATGRKAWPFDKEAVIAFKNQNVHHSRCIETKVASTVGLGHENEATHKTLNELCEVSWQDTLNVVVEDFLSCGDGYLEIVRQGSGDEITGIHHVPAGTVHVIIEDRKYNRHYEVTSREGGTVRFAAFGDLEDASSRIKMFMGSQTKLNEILHLRRGTSLSRWYGFPDFLAAVSCIELVQAILQYNFEFFLNHGVPEYITWILGGSLTPENFDLIKNSLLQSVGLTNQFKAHLFNLPDPLMKVQIDKLAMEKGNIEGAFEMMLDSLSLMIVSAHGVPPLLAGIQIPGKLGANNELPNALVVFQTLVISSEQKRITSILDNTLGNPEKNGGLSLSPGDFKFNTILDKIDLNKVAATSATRKPVGADGQPTDAPADAPTEKPRPRAIGAA